jgi:CheY-like chemotaxis protein
MTIPLMSWPANVVCIDDNQNFLESIGLRIETTMPYSCDLYDGGRAAIESLMEDAGSAVPRIMRDADLSKRNISLELGDIHHLSRDPERFMKPAVVLVDYSMPDMDGLAVCAALRETDAQLVLFTGEADMDVGVGAFNDGLIDYFLPKDKEAGKKLPQMLGKLMKRYFQTKSKFVSDLIKMHSGSILNDDSLEPFIDRLKDAHGYTEQYYVSNPDGFLLLRPDGSASRLIIETDESMRAHEEAAIDNGAPRSLIESIRARHHVPYFWKSGGLYTVACLDWQTYSLPAAIYRGGENYYWAMTDDLGDLDASLISPHSEITQRVRAHY